ncbi:MAG: S8 family serine peptidase, partial [Acidimicrobiales bacterium]|nr:S8 family serine peptidase [Acidimicrobiales bacterium]
MRIVAASVISVIVLVGVMPSSVGAQEESTARTPEQPGTVAPDDRPTGQSVSPRTAPEDAEAPPAAEDADTVVVTFADGAARPSEVEGEAVRSVPAADLAVVDVPDDQTAADFAAELSARGDIATAEPNVTASRFEAPGQTGEFERIGVQDAWTRATGSSDVVVAVVDSGIDPNHPDLSGRLVAGYNFAIPGTYPIEAIHPDPPQYGHGTKVAGVIAAAHGSGTAIEGVAGAGTKIMPLRVFPDGTGGAPLSDIAAAIYFAADNGAEIVNLSLG